MKQGTIGLLGLGNIGGGVWDLLRTFHDELENRTGISIRVKRALVLDKAVHGGHEVTPGVRLTSREGNFEGPEIHIA